jgi:hypothetical protein
MTPLEADAKSALFLVHHSAIHVRGMRLTGVWMDPITVWMATSLSSAFRNSHTFLQHNQEIASGMHEHTEATYQITFLKMFPDHARGCDRAAWKDQEISAAPGMRGV